MIPKRVRWLLATVLAFGVIISGFAVLVGWMNRKRDDAPFQKFFSAKPLSAVVVEYGYDRTMLGDGSYAILFTIQQKELDGFLRAEGYGRVDAKSNPNIWRLELVNSITDRLLKSEFNVKSSFDCYERTTDQTRARVFFDQDRQWALFLGFGRYPR